MTQLTQQQDVLITGGDVVLAQGQVLPNGAVLVSKGLIKGIFETTPNPKELNVSRIIDAKGHWVTPGLIDQHLHGAFGVDFNQGSIVEIKSLLKKLPSVGITAVVPTLITGAKTDMLGALARLEEIRHTQTPDEARVLGFHLEGPFINPRYHGAHPVADMLPLGPSTTEGFFSPSLKRITVAPELEEAIAFIDYCKQKDVLVSIGHSGANFATANHAINAGACCATHLYNAMTRFHHREPGIVAACLLHDDVFVELIADGKHIAPPTVQLTIKAKPFEKTILISDCNALTGLPAGSSMQFGNQTVTIHPDGPKNEDGNLAGSALFLSDCVKNVVEWGVLTFPYAVQMATSHPALHLKESALVGHIQPGAIADLVLWNKDTLDISQVLLNGEPLQKDTALSVN